MIEPTSKTKWILPGLIWIYNTLLAAGLLVLFPLLLPVVLSTAKRRRTFRKRMGWCRYPWQINENGGDSQRIWVHALSVGEVMSAQALVDRLKVHYPDAGIYFTASTLTGFQTACRLFPDQSVHIGYFPYDCIWAVRRVCAMIRPTHAIITETDIWPTFLWEMRRRAVPVYLVNLRLSDRTWENYKRFRWVAKMIYAAFDRVCVQTPKEMDRLIQLGVPANRICVTGNLKFDGLGLQGASTTTSFRGVDLNIPSGHRLIVAGSTHEGEEAILCDVLKPIFAMDARVSLMVAPRDPGRSLSLQTLYRQSDLDCRLFSRMKKLESGYFPQVVIVDSIGVLKELYALADLAFVGGSMAPFGGHNPLEPAYWGKPVLFGTDMRDFALIAEYLLASGGALCVNDADQLKSAIVQLLDHPEVAERMGRHAMRVVKSHQGAVERTLSHLKLAA